VKGEKMTLATVRGRIREFLEPHFGDHDLRDDDDIFRLGYVNSLFAMQLVAFVQQEFGFQVEPDDLDMANFQSIDALTRLTETKLAAL
jgi:acyl carrier protein